MLRITKHKAKLDGGCEIKNAIAIPDSLSYLLSGFWPISMILRASRTIINNSLHVSSALYASWPREFMRPQPCSRAYLEGRFRTEVYYYPRASESVILACQLSSPPRYSLRQATLSSATKQLMPTPRGRRPLYNQLTWQGYHNPILKSADILT